LEVEAGLKRVPQPNTSWKESGARKDGLGMVWTTREPAAGAGEVRPARLTRNAEHLVGEIKRHKTFAGAALLTLLVGAIGLTYFAVNRNELNPGSRTNKSIAVLALKP